MALKQFNGTVSTTANALFTLPSGLPTTAVQINNNHSSAVRLGGSAVSASGATQGLLLAANSATTLWLNPGDTVFAIASIASGTGDIVILYSGV